jgi:hypothetical protein
MRLHRLVRGNLTRPSDGFAITKPCVGSLRTERCLARFDVENANSIQRKPDGTRVKRHWLIVMGESSFSLPVILTSPICDPLS